MDIRRAVAVVLSLSAMTTGCATGARDFPELTDLPPQPGLPDPLVMLDGTPVKTARDWKNRRRPELKAVFEHYMYGVAPPPPDRMRFVVEHEDKSYFGGKATRKLVSIHYGPEGISPIHLLLVVPHTPNRVPVFLGMNFCGNHALLDDPTIPISDQWVYPGYPGVKENRATEASRGTQKEVWMIEHVVSRGYAVATFHNSDIDADTPEWDGVHRHYFTSGQTEPDEHEWGTVAAWAWGISRAVDYLATDRLIDEDRIAVVGHSRLGKTALLAAAMDERIALAIPSQAGCGGTAPSRGKVGESVKQINRNFPHWFNGTFKAFNDRPELLPFDQHGLIALVAPRPVLLSNAVEDEWANPAGQFEVLRAADPVYRLLGVEGLAATEMPPLGKLVESRLGYFIREGKHSMGAEDWEVFLAFADRHFGA